LLLNGFIPGTHWTRVHGGIVLEVRSSSSAIEGTQAWCTFRFVADLDGSATLVEARLPVADSLDTHRYGGAWDECSVMKRCRDRYSRVQLL